jgi:hypothetical protein
MRVAVCLSGQIRNGLEYLDNIFNFCIKDINPDIYIHSYECDGKDKIINFYNPKKSIFEDINVQIPHNIQKYTNKAGEANPHNTINMWRKRKLAFDMLDGEYDRVLITRLDSYSEMSIKNFLYSENLCIPFKGDFYGGIFDLCAWGKMDDMMYYCNLYDNIDSYYEEGVWFHPETLLKHHIEKNKNIQIDRVPINFILRGKIFG